MGEITIDRIPDLTNIMISDIIGLWEVIRIDRSKEVPVYSWIKYRFKFNFVDDMIFKCIINGQQIHGTWELYEQEFETKKRFSIILNGVFKYDILNIDNDEIILSDQLNRYLLTRKL